MSLGAYLMQKGNRYDRAFAAQVNKAGPIEEDLEAFKKRLERGQSLVINGVLALYRKDRKDKGIDHHHVAPFAAALQPALEGLTPERKEALSGALCSLFANHLTMALEDFTEENLEGGIMVTERKAIYECTKLLVQKQAKQAR